MSEAKIHGDPVPDLGGGAEGSAARGFVAEAVRKAVLTTVGAIFLTEESARKLARDWKLPKDLAAYVVAQAQGAKDEIVRVVGQEVRRFLESEAFRREFLKLVGAMTVEVKAEIRLKDSRGRPETKVSVKPRFARGAREREEGGGESEEA